MNRKEVVRIPRVRVIRNPETNSTYVSLGGVRPSVRQKELHCQDGTIVILDFDRSGNVIGLDLLHPGKYRLALIENQNSEHPS